MQKKNKPHQGEFMKTTRKTIKLVLGLGIWLNAPSDQCILEESLTVKIQNLQNQKQLTYDNIQSDQEELSRLENKLDKLCELCDLQLQAHDFQNLENIEQVRHHKETITSNLQELNNLVLAIHNTQIKINKAYLEIESLNQELENHMRMKDAQKKCKQQ